MVGNSSGARYSNTHSLAPACLASSLEEQGGPKMGSMPRLAGRWQRHMNTREVGDPPPPPPLPPTRPAAAGRLTVPLLLLVGPDRSLHAAAPFRSTCGQLNTGCSTVQLWSPRREGRGWGQLLDLSGPERACKRGAECVRHASFAQANIHVDAGLPGCLGRNTLPVAGAAGSAGQPYRNCKSPHIQRCENAWRDSRVELSTSR